MIKGWSAAPRRVARFLLPAPGGSSEPELLDQIVPLRPTRIPDATMDGTGWATVERPDMPARDVIREQRDALARLQRKLLATIRHLQAENAVLRAQLARYQGYPPVEQQERELAEARRLEAERGIPFQRMPAEVYPGKPYVTQLDLIRRGITRYSRQNISRLTRGEKSVPAVSIADRVLLPPTGVQVLLEREETAATDVSPRRRPGDRPSGKRAD